MKDAKKKQRLSGSIEQRIRELRKLQRTLKEEDTRREQALAKEAKASERKEHQEEKVKLQALGRELCFEHATRPGPRKKAASVSKAQLLKLGGVPEMVQRKDGPQEWIIFGPPGETRFIYMPEGSGWRVALDAKPALEEDLKRVLNQSGRNLWNVPEPEQKPDVAATEQKPGCWAEYKRKEKPDIAVQAVDALLYWSQNWQDFSEQKHAMIYAQLAILTTLQALERDFKNKSHKLRLAFEMRTGVGTPSKNDKLYGHAVALAAKLERPPTKKELKNQFDSKLQHPFDPSEFSKRLKETGLSWLKRGK